MITYLLNSRKIKSKLNFYLFSYYMSSFIFFVEHYTKYEFNFWAFTQETIT